MEHTNAIDMNNIFRCGRCGNAYDWRRSTSSSLKMTYCNALCEASDLGFTIDALLKMQPLKAPRELIRLAA